MTIFGIIHFLLHIIQLWRFPEEVPTFILAKTTKSIHNKVDWKTVNNDNQIDFALKNGQETSLACMFLLWTDCLLLCKC
jgi:hypothetical protein